MVSRLYVGCMGREDAVDGDGQVNAPHTFALARCEKDDRPFVRYCGCRLQLENEPYEFEGQQ